MRRCGLLLKLPISLYLSESCSQSNLLTLSNRMSIVEICNEILRTIRLCTRQSSIGCEWTRPGLSRCEVLPPLPDNAV